MHLGFAAETLSLKDVENVHSVINHIDVYYNWEWTTSQTTG